MKSLKEYILESSVGNVDFLEKKLYQYLDTYKASEKYSWAKDQLKNIEKNILTQLPIGSVITWQDHKAEHVEPIIWKVDGKNWRQDLVPKKLAEWKVSNRYIKIEAVKRTDNDMTDEEIKDAAASTTYKATLQKYLSMAKSESTKEFVQQCIDELKAHGKLE